MRGVEKGLRTFAKAKITEINRVLANPTQYLERATGNPLYAAGIALGQREDTQKAARRLVREGKIGGGSTMIMGPRRPAEAPPGDIGPGPSEGDAK